MTRCNCESTSHATKFSRTATIGSSSKRCSCAPAGPASNRAPMKIDRTVFILSPLRGSALPLLCGLFFRRRPRPQPPSQEASAAGPRNQIDVRDEAGTTPLALEHDLAAVEGLELRAMTDAHDRGRIELGS